MTAVHSITRAVEAKASKRCRIVDACKSQSSTHSTKGIPVGYVARSDLKTHKQHKRRNVKAESHLWDLGADVMLTASSWPL